MELEAAILSELQAVEAERRRRLAVPGMAQRVEGLKDYQQRRFAKTYPDLLASDRYRAAARFFLDELYGPRDFTGRDRQFAKIVPSLVRLFPGDVVRTVERLARLHALSEQLDTAMSEVDPGAGSTWNATAYVQAWSQVGRPEDRRRQIAWTLEVGRSLDHLVGKPLLARTLRLMRGPAQLAGLGELQRFLESGFAAFQGMRGAAGFLRVVAEREERLLEALFGPGAGPGMRPGDGSAPGAGADDLLGQLP
jgi:hypothetical protein